MMEPAKIENMKLDSISAISEIAKYYGTLDDAFRLLNSLNTKTRKIWADTSIRLSADIQRKKIQIDLEDRKAFVETLIENKFVLSLFSTKDVLLSTESNLHMLLELFEGIDSPQMIKMIVGLSLSAKRNTLLTLLNYTEYMKYTDFSYFDIYNSIVEAAMRRKIPLSILKCFVFIQEIPYLKDTKFIQTIMFPWNMNSDPETMIFIWSEFCNSMQFDYNEVILIWDDMKFDEFMKIFLAVSKTKVMMKIHSNKNNVAYYYQLFENILLNKLSSISIKLWEIDEYILWTTYRNINEIKLRKWFFKVFSQQNKAIKLSNWFITYRGGLTHNWKAKQSINLGKIKSIGFDCVTVVLTDQDLKRRSDKIFFDQNSIQFDIRLIKNASYRKEYNSLLYFLDKSIRVINSFHPQVKYFKKDYFYNLEITKMALEKDDVSNLINILTNFENIKILSLLINEPSSAIDILSLCKKSNSIKSITLEVIKNFSLITDYSLKLLTNELKCQGKRVSIYKSIKVLKRF